ncbi:hypothetical protein GGI35DRAFT_463988 [Trichoderma velutinum]
MASLLDLPLELHFRITKLLDISDKAHLSATCKLYRTQLLPEVFNTIRFTSDEASAVSALAAIEAHGQYTKTIEFTCQYEDPDAVPMPPSLPPEACKVLKGHLTPHLQRVRIKFDLGLDNDTIELNEVYYRFGDVEDADRTLDQERREIWRALLNETWEGLVTNTLVRELIINELPPTWTSTYYTNTFHQFLNQLESVTIYFLGYIDSAENRTRTGFGCQEFLGSLGDLFFRHMKGLKYLHVNATDPLGLEKLDGMETYIPLSLEPDYFPLLRTLKLEYCFICRELVSFIQGHAQVLESLDINECFSKDPDEDAFPGQIPRGLTWEEFFDEVYKAKPRLTELIVGDNNLLFVEEEERFKYMWSDDMIIERIRQKLKEDSTLKAYRYGSMADDGTFMMDEDTNVNRFIKGDDQRAYNRLMALVKKNRAGKVKSKMHENV